MDAVVLGAGSLELALLVVGLGFQLACWQVGIAGEVAVPVGGCWGLRWVSKELVRSRGDRLSVNDGLIGLYRY